jgi:hypothetical protein
MQLEHGEAGRNGVSWPKVEGQVSAIKIFERTSVPTGGVAALVQAYQRLRQA